MAETVKHLIKRNLWWENQVVRQILGICSSLAVSNLMANSLVMGLGLTFVTALSSFTLSLLRNAIPRRIRMIVQTLIIAAYVILVDLFIKAMLPDISKALGPYVALIITNCIIMGRAEAFAQQNPPVPALLDGFYASCTTNQSADYLFCLYPDQQYDLVKFFGHVFFHLCLQ